MRGSVFCLCKIPFCFVGSFICNNVFGLESPSRYSTFLVLVTGVAARGLDVYLLRSCTVRVQTSVCGRASQLFADLTANFSRTAVLNQWGYSSRVVSIVALVGAKSKP